MATAYVALGANLGDRLANLRSALDRMPAAVRVEAVSSLYETDPVTPDGEDQPQYYNAAACLEVNAGPAALLYAFKSIEGALGRDPDAERWAPRPIDIDLLLYDDAVIADEDLTVPHPRMLQRPFVLVPLAEIAPDVTHPVARRTIAELAHDLGEEGVRKVAGGDWF